MSKRILAMLLAVMLLVGMLPTDLFAFTASAEEVSVSMEALVAETEITVDGDFSETAWSNWTIIPASAEGAPSGSVAAAWDLEKLYLAINADADTAALTVNGKTLTVDLSAGKVTGVDGAVYAGTNGVVEIAIPMASLGIALSEYGQSVDISCSLTKGEATSTLAANNLILSGKVAAVMDLSDDKKFENACNYNYTDDGTSVTIQPTATGAYFIRTNEVFNLSNEFFMSYDLEFNEAPIYSFYWNGTYNSFDHQIVAPDGNSVYYAVYYTGEETGLVLVVRDSGDAGTDHKFPLNRGLKEKFQLTFMTHMDGSADFFVDGDYLGTVENAVYSQSMKFTWSYWKFNTAALLNNSSVTISDVKTLETKYTGKLPVTTGNLEALVAEDAVQVDGELSELAWSSWAKVMPAKEGAPSGGVAAAWDKETLYLAINTEADTAALTVNGKALTVDLSTGAVTGAANADSKAGTNGVVEIAIPMASLGIAPYQYGQTVAISGSLSKGGVVSYLAADKLILSGKVAVVAVMNLDDGKTLVNESNPTYNDEGTSATLKPALKDAFFIRVDEEMNLGSEFVMSYNLEFTQLPNYTNIYDGSYNGFTHQITTKSEDAVMYGISYPSEAKGLLLAVRSSDDEGTGSLYEFPLNRGLNEKFQLTCMVHTDGSADFFVDGDYLGTANNVVFDQNMPYQWSYWRFAQKLANNSSFTISNLTSLQTKYTGVFAPVVDTRSISLTGNIALNYFLEIPEAIVNDETAHMLFTLPDGSTEQVFVKGAVKEDDGRYRFSCAVAAREMTGTIKAQFIYNGGSTKVYDYSIRDYAKEEELPDSGVLKDLLDAMLRYGGSAQRYFGTNKDDQADANNRWSEEALNGVTAETLSSYKMVRENTDGATITSASLFLRSETTLRVYFTVADGTEFTVLDGTTPLTAVKDGDRYYVDIENIAAQHLEEKHQITVKDSNSNTLATASVSALSYCHMVLTAANTTAGEDISVELKELAKALYLYNQAANAYFI